MPCSNVAVDARSVSPHHTHHPWSDTLRSIRNYDGRWYKYGVSSLRTRILIQYGGLNKPQTHVSDRPTYPWSAPSRSRPTVATASRASTPTPRPRHARRLPALPPARERLRRPFASTAEARRGGVAVHRGQRRHGLRLNHKRLVQGGLRGRLSPVHLRCALPF